MKYILVPTDFSDLGNYAYDVANIIAKNTSAKIIAISIVPGPQGALYSNSGQLLNDDGNDYTEWDKKLSANKTKMVDWMENKSNIIDSFCTIGNVDKTILEFSEDNDIDLIVMGTNGLFQKSIWTAGSHAEYITSHSEIPVLTLKCDRSDLDLNEIVLVSDFLENKKIDLKIVKEIQKAYKSKILLLKIKTPKYTRDDEKIRADMEAWAKTNILENYSINIYPDSGVESGIGKFCAAKDIDLIALGTHQSNGFSKLFKENISDDVVNHLFHPILTFPIV